MVGVASGGSRLGEALGVGYNPWVFEHLYQGQPLIRLFLEELWRGREGELYREQLPLLGVSLPE